MASAPPTLPLPPARHPFLVWPEPASTWYRVHNFDVATRRFGPTQFNDTDKGDARFSPLIDPSTGRAIPTLYAGATPAAAIGEVVLRDPEPIDRLFARLGQR